MKGLCPVILLAVVVCGCSLPGQLDPAKRPLRPEEVTDFDDLFDNNCTGCHGANGRGGPAPPLHDARFLAIFDELAAEQVISRGREGTLMPAFERPRGTLTKDQVGILAKGLRQKWGSKQTWTEATPPYRDLTAVGDAKAGEQVFHKVCADCHGSSGRGGWAGSLNRPGFLALTSREMWRRIMITGRSDLDPAMPAFNGHAGGPLTSKEINDVAELMESWRQAGR